VLNRVGFFVYRFWPGGRSLFRLRQDGAQNADIPTFLGGFRHKRGIE
jgi:hypothetical protein